MSVQMTVTLSDKMHDRLRRLARTRRQDIAQTLTEHLDQTLPSPEIVSGEDSFGETQTEALDREEAAYLRLHPQLKETHFGQYVAIYNGKLIDSDSDFGTMVERVRKDLPHQVVWMTQVKEIPIQTIVRHGFRFVQSSE